MISTPCAMRSFSRWTAATHLAILVDDHVDDVGNGGFVDGETDGIDGFGRQRLPLRLGGVGIDVPFGGSPVARRAAV